MKANLPSEEVRRLAALREYNALDTPPEQAFDDLTLLAAQICGTPIALVSLVDGERQWFKSKQGLATPDMPRDMAFCAHAILSPDKVLEVTDASLDPRFADNPLVTSDPHFRFYAGAPLVTSDGYALGSLCVIDYTPRKLSPEQLIALRALGRQVIAQLELNRQARKLLDEAVERERAEALLNEQYTQLLHSKKETDVLLTRAERLRASLLSLVEDERRAGKKLRESEERFRELAENINEVFWITDPTMHELHYVSPAYEKIWGRSCASLYASPRQWIEMIHPEDVARVLEAISNISFSGGFEITYRILRPDKAVRWIYDKGFPVLSAERKVHRIVGTAEDITEQKTLEDQFRQAQKMESIGQLAGGIAHDFNNILGAIMGNLYLAKLEASDNTEVLNYLGEIDKASERARHLVKQILAFSRQNKPERKPVNLNEVVQEALKLLRASIPATIRIQTELTETPAVLADATAIHQVIMNLGVNAWHAMRDEPGVLKVEAIVMEVDEDYAKSRPELHAGPYVRLSVNDTGRGMDAATLEHIFEPFFTTKPVGEGTGLGLAVVHGIMKSHEGGIFVHSQPGQGTTFYLHFPVLKTELIASSIESKPIPAGHGEHIMVVDDEEPLARAAEKMLKRLGYVVTTQTIAFEAIAAFRNDPGQFDLVLIDLTMPHMDGATLGTQLLRIKPGIPIIITTGNSGQLTMEKLRMLGFKELLPKPSTAQALGEAVHRALYPLPPSEP